jgi:phosphoglycerate dehydrogenase-like enzyme
MENVAFTLVMLPPQNDIRRGWAARVAEADVGVRVLQPETIEEAKRDIVEADAAFGALPLEVLKCATRLRWLQAPQIAPPAGFYYPELVDHPVVVTNQREIFNDHIGAHIMAFVLAFARGLHYYLPQQYRREYKPRPNDTGVVHLPEASALILGVGGIGAEAARLCKAFGMTVIGVDGR